MISTLYDFVERLAHVVPEALNMLRAQSPDGFCHVTEQLLGTAIAHLEEQGKNLRGDQVHEDTITVGMLGFFHRYGIRASSHTNSRGHVDIYIGHTWKADLVICCEAKIWRGAAYHIAGLGQVLGYCTGRMPYCFILAYVKTGPIAEKIADLGRVLDTDLPERQQAPSRPHETLRWALVTEHNHSSGVSVTVVHAGVNLA